MHIRLDASHPSSSRRTIPPGALVRLASSGSHGPRGVQHTLRRKRRTISDILIAAFFLTACDDGSADPQGFAQRDSAGIEIAESERPSWSEDDGLTLSALPTLVIGAPGGSDYDLSGVVGAARLADGRVVIANGGTLQLRFYDAAGTFLHSAGGQGEGPGELTGMERFDHLPGDTLAVVSDGFRSLSLFDSKGTFLHRLQLGTLPLDLSDRPRIVMPLGHGSYLLGRGGRPPGRASGERWIESMDLVVLGPDSVVRHLPGPFPAAALVMQNGFPANLRFGPAASFAASGDSFFWGVGDEYSIGQYSFTGQLQRMIRRRWSPAVVTSANIDRFVEEWSERWIKSTGAEAERQRQAMRNSAYADTVPAFSQFIVDRSNRLWVREANVADAAVGGMMNNFPVDASRWSVFDLNGRWLGDVPMPARFLPTDIGTDYVLGIARGDLDVQTVVQYDLRPGVEAL